MDFSKKALDFIPYAVNFVTSDMFEVDEDEMIRAFLATMSVDNEGRGTSFSFKSTS